MAQFHIKNYWKPTPLKLRQLGDAMVAVSLYSQTQQMFTGHSYWLNAVGICGLAGKFLTNFFTDNPNITYQPPDQEKETLPKAE